MRSFGLLLSLGLRARITACLQFALYRLVECLTFGALALKLLVLDLAVF